MHIANPIYDVVFKYLMEDGKIAKLLISSIIGEEIEELVFRPQEFSSDIDKSRLEGSIGTLTVYRLDFTATIKTDEGVKNVIIEIQKAKFATDIMRFRSYLGSQYSDTNNTRLAEIKNHTRRVGIPVISIYFLGHKLDHTDSAVIGIRRSYTDLITGEELTTKESFIESLTHDSYVIQIPNLSRNRRSELETLLSVFDQSRSVDSAHHVLNVQEEEFPEKYRTLIRRLQMAVSEPAMRKHMTLEDGILLDFEDMQRKILDAHKTIEEERQKSAEAKKKISAAEKKTAEAEKKAAESRLTIARNLRAAGVSVEVVMQATGLSRDEIEVSMF